MKALILAGGLGTRISEETIDKPKPMVLVGDQPILWHVMSIFSAQGFNEFVIALGYKGDIIQTWIENMGGQVEVISPELSCVSLKQYVLGVEKEWTVYLLETGLTTQTGGRIRKALEAFPNEDLMVTYGDGLGNINISKLLDFHKKMSVTATVTAVHPPARFGHLLVSNGLVTYFGEKRAEDLGWINGGFFVLNQTCFDFIPETNQPFELNAMNALTNKGQLSAYSHEGFWQPMDTLRDKIYLNELVNSSQPPPWLVFC